MHTRFFKLLTVLICLTFPLSSCAPTGQNSLSDLGESPVENQTQPTPAPTKSIWNPSNINLENIDENKKYIVFTFDDSPAKSLETLTGVFLNFNKENPDCQANATLFCNGARINEHTLPALQTAYAVGFELGNHTYSHLDLTKLSKDQLLWEIERTDNLLQEIDGQPLHLLRPPYGNSNQALQETVKVPIISWLIDTLDWTKKSGEEIYQTVFSQKSDGAIVLFHDGYEGTVSAIKRLLPDLKEAGYQVVSVSQASKINDCPLYIGSTYIRERKPKDRK